MNNCTAVDAAAELLLYRHSSYVVSWSVWAGVLSVGGKVS